MEASHPVSVSYYPYLEKLLPPGLSFIYCNVWDLLAMNRQDPCTVLCLGRPPSPGGWHWAGEEGPSVDALASWVCYNKEPHIYLCSFILVVVGFLESNLTQANET